MNMNVVNADQAQERFSADELRLLQGILATDRKTIDYIENVVGGTDLTDRRASAQVLVLKVRRLLDRELAGELEERKKQMETQAPQAPQAPADPRGNGSPVLPFPSAAAAANIVPVPEAGEIERASEQPPMDRAE